MFQCIAKGEIMSVLLLNKVDYSLYCGTLVAHRDLESNHGIANHLLAIAIALRKPESHRCCLPLGIIVTIFARM